MAEIDDVWGTSDDEKEYERDLAEREWERLQEDHGNTGYKEGIVEGKEVNMQKGFDRGYVEGLAVGKEVGRLRGIVSTYIVFYAQMLKKQDAADELAELFDELDKIEAHNVYSVDYFRENGPKDVQNYISPETFVKQLQDKVKAKLDSVVQKYNDRS